ncbi:MAG: adenylosuccinate lyase [Bacteroidales bacterium]
MILNNLTAISPIDGRYRTKCENLDLYFSEFALIKYRVKVEVEYFIALCEANIPELQSVPKDKFEALRDIYRNFTLEDAEQVKDEESVTNHDVKAVEYFLKKKFPLVGVNEKLEYIHFALTSQDINNTATPLSLKDAIEAEYLPMLQELVEILSALAEEWKDVSMLAKTHGQPASPTNLGKEIRVFIERLNDQLNMLKDAKLKTKFGGATGNFNAHHAAYPNIDWQDFANNFTNKYLGVARSKHTTQIAHYDDLAAIFDNLKRINNIILDLDRDFWSYISMEYFKQKIKAGEVGSSAMPHKVNPIDFENSEGNVGMANAIFEHLAAKLPVSRLQRDLTDSTVLRNIGVPLAHSIIAMQSTIRGLNKLLLNKAAIDNDLEKNWAVVAEAIQTILKREDYPKPYEALKDLTRANKPIDKDLIHNFIDTLNVSKEVKDELKAITPHNYTGIF